VTHAAVKSVTVKPTSTTKYSILYAGNDCIWGRNTAHSWTLWVKFCINI